MAQRELVFVLLTVIAGCSSRATHSESTPDAASGGTDAGATGGASAAGGAAGVAGAGGNAGQAGGGSSGASACGIGANCVQSPPVGWQGPIAVWSGAANTTPPSCQVGLEQVVEAYEGVGWTGATCSACSCAQPSNMSCRATVDVSNADTCGGTTQTLTNVGAGCVSKSVADSFGWARVTSFVPTGGTCQPSGGANTSKRPALGKALVGCSGITSPATCAGTCVLDPPALFDQICIYMQANAECPAGEYTKKHAYTTYTDGRKCSPCSCGAPTGGSCAGKVFVSNKSDCTGTTTELTFPGSCTQLAATVVSDVSAGVNAASIPTPPTCAHSGGVAMGKVDVVGPITVCCRE